MTVFDEALAAVDVYGETGWQALARRVVRLMDFSALKQVVPLFEVFDLVEAEAHSRYGVPETPRCSSDEAAEALLSAWAKTPVDVRARVLGTLAADDELALIFSAAERERARRTETALLEGDVFNDGELGERLEDTE